jgi:hypothetical protein
MKRTGNYQMEFFHDKRSRFQRHFPSVTSGPVAVLSEPVKLNSKRMAWGNLLVRDKWHRLIIV